MRIPDVHKLRHDLKRAELLIQWARNLMNEGVRHVDAALAFLEEAQRWLPQKAQAKPFKSKLRVHPRPESILFLACSGLLKVRGRLNRELGARQSHQELVRVQELVREAFAELKEAWLTYLYAHGLPFGYKPVQTMFQSGGIAQYSLWALALVFGSTLARDFVPKGRWWSDYLFPVWTVVCTYVQVFLGRPKLRRTGPTFVARTAALKQLLPVVLVLAGLPFLGVLLRPDLLRLFGTFSLVSLGVAMPSLVQALRLLRFPEEARVLLLPARPSLYVVFVRSTAFVREDKVFLPILF